MKIKTEWCVKLQEKCCDVVKQMSGRLDKWWHNDYDSQRVKQLWPFPWHHLSFAELPGIKLLSFKAFSPHCCRRTSVLTEVFHEAGSPVGTSLADLYKLKQSMEWKSASLSLSWSITPPFSIKDRGETKGGIRQVVKTRPVQKRLGRLQTPSNVSIPPCCPHCSPGNTYVRVDLGQTMPLAECIEQ